MFFAYTLGATQHVLNLSAVLRLELPLAGGREEVVIHFVAGGDTTLPMPAEAVERLRALLAGAGG